jgi:hypothetical protein
MSQTIRPTPHRLRPVAGETREMLVMAVAEGVVAAAGVPRVAALAAGEVAAGASEPQVVTITSA